MKPLTDAQTKTRDREAIETELSTRVYQAALMIEQLELAGRVTGNGHHAAQQIADYAVAELRSRWLEEEGEA